jgi:hypothetical protein
MINSTNNEATTTGRKADNINHNVPKLDRFLWWCAGANTDILKKCPTDHSKYFGLGGTIMFTALMASFAGGYAFFTAFHSIPLAFLFGIFWGLLIFNLDRYIVSSAGKGDGTVKITKEEWSNSAPRLVLAILIGGVIAVPLELKVFEKEINVEIEEMINERKKELVQGQNYNLKEIQRVKDRIADLRGEEKRLQIQIEGGDPRINISEETITELGGEEKEVDKQLTKLEPLYKKAKNDYAHHRNRRKAYEQDIASLSNGDTFENQQQIRELQNKLKEHKRKERKARKVRDELEPKVSKLRTQKSEITKNLASAESEIKGVQKGLSQDYQSLLDKNKNEIDKLNQRLTSINNVRDGEIHHSEEIAEQFNGLMARLIALDRLSVEVDTIHHITKAATLSALEKPDSVEPTQTTYTINEDWTPVFYAKWLLTLLIICIEITPILFKMMTESGPYDDRIEEIRYKSEVDKKKFISDLNEKINTELKLSNGRNQNKIDTELTENKKLMEEIAQAQGEIAAIAIQEWKRRKMEEVEKDPEMVIRERKV